jgi:ketosteroid isomerase-like protein
MSEENVEIVRRALELFRQRKSDAILSEDDVAAFAEFTDPEFELDASRAPMEDIRGVFRGAAVAEFWRDWLEAWGSLEFDEEIVDAGDHVFVAFKRQTMRGRGSGVEVEFPPYAQVFTFRDRKIVRQAIYLDEDEARRAAGLSE